MWIGGLASGSDLRNNGGNFAEAAWIVPQPTQAAGEPDEAELVRLSKRLVESAVLKAVQQYLEETQNKNKPGDGSSVKTDEADRNGTDSDNRK
ncbi:hypothetical protein MC885_015423 [Smutsia gigantea]|nr:hypothetical protein MC885_015423 [Smutsia gigantea]